MSQSDAASLLRLLQGSKTPSLYQTPPNHSPAPSSPSHSIIQPSKGQDLLDILKSSHPDHVTGAPPASHPSSAIPPATMDGAATARPPSGQSVRGGVIERPKAADQSASLLSLLQTMGQVAKPVGGASAQEPRPAPPPSSPPTKPHSANLLMQLMGGHAQSTGSLPQPLPPPESDAALTSSSSQTKSPSPPPPPPPPPATSSSPFNFVSPFDFLAQAHAASVAARDKAKAQNEPVSASSSSDPLQLPSRVDQSSPHASSVGSGPSSVRSEHRLASSKVSPSRNLLAASFLPLPGTATSPSVAQPLQAGVPVDGTKPLVIFVDEEGHAERMYINPDPSSSNVTPITLFDIPFERKQGISAGVSSKAFCYSTKHGKIRVLDRQTGAKLLLKGQTSSVGDLRVAPAPDSFTSRGTSGQQERTRMIASVGPDSKLVVWRVPDAFDSNDPGTEKVLDIQGAPSAANGRPRYQLIRFHPHFPMVPILAVVLDNGTIAFVDLEHQQAASGGEDLLLGKIGRVAFEGASETIDFAFSPDGSAFVVLSANGTYSVCLTEEPSCPVLFSSALPFLDSSTLSNIAFISAPQSRPTALAVSSQNGNTIHIIPLAPSSSPALAPSVSFAFSGEQRDESSFGHMEFHSASSTLFASQSLRGSLFAFRLAFDPLAHNAGSVDDDAALLAIFADESKHQVGQSQCPVAPTVESVLEIPTPEHIIDFVLDAADAHTAASLGEGGHGVTSADALGASSAQVMSAICVHPKGIHQISFQYRIPAIPSTAVQSPRLGGPDLVDDILAEAGPGGRRLSLEGSILVSSETAVHVEHHLDPTIPEEPRTPLSADLPPSTPAPGGTAEPVLGDLGVPETEALDFAKGIKLESTSSSAAALPEAPTTSSAPASIGKVGGKKGRKGAGAAPSGSEDRSVKLESPSESSSGNAVTNAWASGNAKKLPTASAKVDQGDLIRELKKMEESMPELVRKVVSEQLDKQAQRAEEDRLAERVVETARQETALKLLTSAMTKTTGKLIESSIDKQIKTQVVPSIAKAVGAAVSEQISNGVAQALAQTLPDELERLLFRPELSAHLARNYSTTIGPSLERNLITVVTKAVVPGINESVTAAITTLMRAVNQEMVDVRKEIVREQSDSLEFTERQVTDLRGEVGELRETLGRMEKLLAGLGTSASGSNGVRNGVAASTNVPLSPRGNAVTGQQPRRVSGVDTAPIVGSSVQPRRSSPQRDHSRKDSTTRAHEPASPPRMYNLPPIPRPATPVEEYEDLFLNVLSPENEPEFTGLKQFISSAPPSRLDALFPPSPQAPRITSAIVHSLAFRLGQVIQAQDGALDSEGEKYLVWVRQCIDALDGTDEETGSFTAGILQDVYTNLVRRGKELMGMSDRRGADLVRIAANEAKMRYDSLS